MKARTVACSIYFVINKVKLYCYMESLMIHDKLFSVFSRIRMNFLDHLEEWTEQAAERASSVVVAKVHFLLPYQAFK